MTGCHISDENGLMRLKAFRSIYASGCGEEKCSISRQHQARRAKEKGILYWMEVGLLRMPDDYFKTYIRSEIFSRL